MWAEPTWEERKALPFNTDSFTFIASETDLETLIHSGEISVKSKTRCMKNALMHTGVSRENEDDEA